MSNIYLISQDVNDGHDTYDSAVVIADSEQEAQQIHPSSYYPNSWAEEKIWQDWANKPEQVQVKLLGVALDTLTSGTVICASYNAG